ncbi:MAG TPA: DUF3300 domain-containing protein, partial [Steroidobacteraceae bacterium]|nr:DUF3300 domain-containing protein [Steroidobacteraceae bacterium]
CVKTALRLLAAIALSLGALGAHAQQRIFSQAELDTLLAPIALYPDPLLTHVLNASVYPDQVEEAAAWSRANPQLQGDAALDTVESTSWHPSIKALVAYPDVLQRLAESPQWLADLGDAYTGQAAYVSATVQQLRARAQATGYLHSNETQYVYQQGPTIVVQPMYPNVVYAPYYDPYVVYGTWWWPAYRPLCWRPFVAHPVFVNQVFVKQVFQPVPVRIVERPVRFVRPGQVTPFHNVPESQRRPIIQSAPAVGQPVRSAPPGPSARWRFPTAHSAPAARQPVRSAPIVRSMPAPQVRFNEPRFNRGYQAAAGAGVRSSVGSGAMRSGGSNRGGGHHRG